jgi:hypothetical protein
MSSCSLAARFHRRAGEQLIAYDVDNSGTLATVYRLEKRNGEWFRVDLGAVRGSDPMNTVINVALGYTKHDHELFGLIATQIERRTDEVTSSLRYLNNKLPVALEDIEIAHASLARYV